MRDWDDEGHGQNKVLCSSSKVKLSIVKLLLQAPQRSLCQEDRSPASCRLLARKPHRLRFLLAASSLSPLPCCLFFVASSLSSLFYCLFLIISSLSPHLARFLARLVGRLCFCLAGNLTVDLAIGGVVSMAGEVAVGLSRWSLWNKLMSFLKCWIAEASFQVFSSSRYLFHETR